MLSGAMLGPVTVGGLPTFPITRRGLAEVMLQDCLEARRKGPKFTPRLVFSSNGQGVALAGRNRAFRDAMLQADIIHGDGQSVVFAIKLTRAPLPERVATTDFFHDAAKVAEESGLRFFILGGSESLNERAVAAIQSLYPAINICGSRHGYFSVEDEPQVCEEIRSSGTDVLWVGLGKPLQEFWSVRNRNRLGGVAWVKTCGGLYSFLVGDSPRAPEIMRRSGFEWLYRVWREPSRLILRYATTNPYSAYKLLTQTHTTTVNIPEK